MKNVLIIAGLLLAGCTDGKDSGATGDSGDTDTSVTTPSASVSWGASSVTVTVTDGDDITFFGLAETAGCDDCWTGEDCLGGYELSDGSLIQECHPISGGSLTLNYGGDPNALSAGSETVFGDNSFDGNVTYYLEDSAGNCYVFGNDTSYYAGEGCTEI